MEMKTTRNGHMLNWTATQSLNALTVISDVDLQAWTEKVLEGSDDSLRRYLLDSDTASWQDGLLSPTASAATFNLSQMLSPPPSPVHESLEINNDKLVPVIKIRDHLDSTCCADIDSSYEELLNLVGINDMEIPQPLSPEEVVSALEVEVQEEVITSEPSTVNEEDWSAMQQELEFPNICSPEAVVDFVTAGKGELIRRQTHEPFSRRKQSLQSYLASSPSSESGTESISFSPPPPKRLKKGSSSVTSSKEKKLVQKERKRLSNRESAARYREKVKALRDAEERRCTQAELENQQLKTACKEARDEELMLVELLREVESLRRRLQVGQL